MTIRQIGALAVATIALVSAACTSAEPGDRNVTTPAGEPVNPVDATAVEVATDFLEAYGTFDVGEAMTYLADDATIASLGAQDDLGLLVAWLEATGYAQILDPCAEVTDSASGTIVRCTYDFHALRSDQIGRGPFGGASFDLTVRDGEIVRASQNWEIEEFSPQVWEPFADWVSATYPKDAAVMYLDASHSNVRLTEESIRLWERRTQEYVEEVGGA